MGWTPSFYINLSQKEKAFITATILIKLEEEKKEQQKLKVKHSRGRRR